MPENPEEKEIQRKSPVELLDTGSKHTRVEQGLALCLSGGGYRAMLFHLGALWRLNEMGYLPKLERVSSVSGGSITAAVLGLNWHDLDFNQKGVAENFTEAVVKPVRFLGRKTIDERAIFSGLFSRSSINSKIIRAYRKYLFGEKTLQDLPDKPRFVINSTSVQSGALWRFMKPYMRDWRVGEVKQPQIELAFAVAASSAFPPVLSPAVMKLKPSDFTPGSGKDLQRKPFTARVVLTDGGVYDNLGLETAWKRYSAILVSDAGGAFEPEGQPGTNWVSHLGRVISLIDNQVRCLRKRQLIGSYVENQREGAYWGIRTDISNYGLEDSLECPLEKTLKIADVPTRLKKIKSAMQERLINWGYAVTDAAVRCHYDSSHIAPAGFPYPRGV